MPVKTQNKRGAQGTVSFVSMNVKPPKDVCIATGGCGSPRKPVIVAPRGNNKHDPRFQPQRKQRPVKIRRV